MLIMMPTILGEGDREVTSFVMVWWGGIHTGTAVPCSTEEIYCSSCAHSAISIDYVYEERMYVRYCTLKGPPQFGIENYNLLIYPLDSMHHDTLILLWCCSRTDGMCSLGPECPCLRTNPSKHRVIKIFWNFYKYVSQYHRGNYHGNYCDSAEEIPCVLGLEVGSRGKSAVSSW